MYDRSLFATFNGGKRWQRVDLGEPVVALASSGGSAYALVGDCPEGVGDCRAPMRLFEGTIATGRWRFVTLGFDLPPTDTGSLVVSRSGVYALAVGENLDQTFMARTGAGRWERRPLPCPRALVTGIEAEEGLVAACRPPSSSAPVELQTSSDGGKTWAVVWQHTFPSAITSLAVTGQVVVLALENGDIVRSMDNGVAFSSAIQVGAAPGVRFTDGEHGILLAGPRATAACSAPPTAAPPGEPSPLPAELADVRRIQTGPGHEQECVLAPVKTAGHPGRWRQLATTYVAECREVAADGRELLALRAVTSRGVGGSGRSARGAPGR